MVHAGRHKQADRLLCFFQASQFGNDTVEVVDAVARGDEIIVPTVIDDELAAVRGEVSEIGIDGFEQVVVVEFFGERDVFVSIECAEIQAGFW